MISHAYLRMCVLGMMLVTLAATASIVVPAAEAQSSIQDWYQLYTSAKDDIKRQAWAEAEKKLLQAKQSGPSQGPRTLVRGGLIVPFSADYYLGEAYMEQGRAREAIAAFEAAGKQNLNVRTGEFARLGERRTTAVTRLTDDLIKTAQDDVAKGDLGAARTKAQEARTLGGNAAGVENLLASIKAAEDRAGAKNAGTAGGISNPAQVPVNPKLPPNPAPVATAPPTTAQVGGAATAQYSPPGAEGGTSKAAAEADLERSRVRARAEALTESAAMRQFFSGDYASAITTLTPLSTPRALFYRSCSRAGLALLSGGGDSATLSLARQEYRDALVGSTNFSRDEPYISPRVLQLLRAQE